ncbi:hypothetical protein [Tenacibaculum maritimum]|uniref:Lipoprotein n=2 Tax=Tenacibaculum maritimum TaxID=107401 RepID=A0A2H1E9S7_9FLAO|nr:hypothetical protein [Tenacibaculum maritimum]MCD9562703.1 hypothetical protein [Tenacibaculum maritimum]MCD9564765.1 hypothetical protein [Tenacibaculum maritimum]MCD9577894.1 hypothetical protein [Tenacibaculum maritimum]MCD9582328.1 hypothetical protein [Tenacibaculum maritimum]MCD9583470.1 hypothetical protein [Tenacibaculum maritimum]
MKKIHTYFLLCSIALISFATSCPQEPFCDNQTAIVTTESIAIKVTSNTNLSQNDTIWLSLEIPNTLKDINGAVHNIEINANSSIFPYIRTQLKNDFDTFSDINFGTHTVSTFGTVQTYDGNINLGLEYKKDSNSLYCKAGLILKEKGIYKINVGSFYPISMNYKEYVDCPKKTYNIPLTFNTQQNTNHQEYTFTVN